MIAEKIKYYQSELADAKLIAVSKKKSVEDILEAYEAGQRDFGENYIQELVEKKEQLPDDIRWHFIGHLQRNKVKYISEFIHLIHAVDSIRLIKEINKQALKQDKMIDVLLQLHLAQENSKFGIPVNDFESFIGELKKAQISNVRIKGLMTMASNTDDTDQIKSEFEKAKKFSILLQTLYPDAKELSMGMSGDYKLAIEQGSTMVRIGSSIFGKREY